MQELIAVCSAKPHASTQSMRGHQWWKRDVYHLRRAESKFLTRCGRDCSEWLVIGEIAEVDDNCCSRCLAVLATPKDPHPCK